MSQTIDDPEARVRAALGAVSLPGRQGEGTPGAAAARAWAEGFGVVSPDVERYAEVLRAPADALIVAMRNIARDQMETLEKRLAAIAGRGGPAMPKGPAPKGAMKGMQRTVRRR